MDRFFDVLARKLAQPTTRRASLRGLMGIAAATFLAACGNAGCGKGVACAGGCCDATSVCCPNNKCCPEAEAVCCNDGCCAVGTQCNTSNGTCVSLLGDVRASRPITQASKPR